MYSLSVPHDVQLFFADAGPQSQIQFICLDMVTVFLYAKVTKFSASKTKRPKTKNEIHTK
jgi:hypothetical protein